MQLNNNLRKSQLTGKMRGLPSSKIDIKACFPWQAKMAAKLILPWLSVGYTFWSGLGLFRHGKMDQSSYAYGVFKQHYELAKPRDRFVSLELGPGDSLASALLSSAFGGSASYLVDVGEFAQEDLKPYHDLAKLLNEKNMLVPSAEKMTSLDGVLVNCKSRYLTDGLSSLQTIPAQSIDFIYSHAVLEHIRAADFLSTMQELRRVIRKDEACSHRVDLQDHLSGSLNNLRFSEKFWESVLISKSGFYTNRIGFPEMIALFQQAGFDTHVVKIDRWGGLPTPRAKLAERFRQIPDEHLCISGFTVVLRPV